MAALSPLDPLDPNIPPKQSPTKLMTMNKPLAPAPSTFDHVPSEVPIAATPPTAHEISSQTSRASLSEHPSFHRSKRRLISQRNKACIVALPFGNGQGQRTSRRDPLRAKEVAECLKEWGDKGFDTAGFILASSQGQSRAVYPDPEDEKHDRLRRSYRVCIPDRQEWEIYVNQLKEEKLRALGVSFGDEYPPLGRSPAPSLMSRQASSQSSFMLTSPLLTAASMPPNSLGPTYQVGGSQPVKHGVSHFPRYSIATPLADKGIHHPSQFPQSHSPVHASLPSRGYISSQYGSRLGSPNINEQVVNSYSSLSPAPRSARNGAYPVASQDTDEPLTRLPGQQVSLLAPHLQQYHHQPQEFQQRLRLDMGSPRYSNKDMERAHDQSHSDILTPMPVGHRQNPSETLQREVEEAEAYLEEAKKANAEPKITQMKGQERVDEVQEIIVEQVEASEANNRRVRMPDSEIDTTNLVAAAEMPNVRGTPDSNHASTSSVASRLNGDAPEFKFEPKTAIAPDVFSFLEQQQPFRLSEKALSLPPKLVHPRKTSLALSSRKLNVAAPVFKPGPATTPVPTVTSRVFSFGADPISSNGGDGKASAAPQKFSFFSEAPALNPDAPVFKPGEPVGAADDKPTKDNPIGEVKKIFGDFVFTDIINAAKRSKAVPIIRPGEEDRGDGESDGPEDESGRITQSDPRQKRIRRDQDDGDQVPLFAFPSDNPRLVNSGDMGAAFSSNTHSPSSSGQEPTTLEAATDLLEEIIDDMSASESSRNMREEPAKSNERAVEPFTFHDADQAASFNAARPPSLPGADIEGPANPNPADIPNVAQGSLRQSSQFASAFEQKVNHRLSRSPSISDSLSERGRNDLSRIERIDHAEHERQAAAVRQDVLEGVRYVDPSFHEIDAVMKHLNQNGDSDFGIERHPSPWRRCSPTKGFDDIPHRGLQESVSRQLLPPANIRSDAPSPSPNRLHEPFQYLPPTDTESADSAVAKLVARSARYSPSFRPSRNSPSVHRLNSPGSTPPSDWNDAISSIDENKFIARVGFFDSKVHDMVECVVHQQLAPLEKTLSSIRESLTALSKRAVSRTASRRPRSSGTIDVLNSDADDEDESDGLSQSRLKSPLRDRKYDQLKASIDELADAQRNSLPTAQLVELLNTMNDLKKSVSQAPCAATPTSSIKHVVEEAVNRQMRGKSAPVLSTSQAAAAEKSQLQIAGLESMLKVAETRAEDEMKARRATEDALADNQRLLRQALHEAAQQRESAEATERSLREYYEERQHNLKHTAVLEGCQESLEKTVSDLAEKNEALESTLAEYRLSHGQWRTDLDNVRRENKELHRNLQSLKTGLDNSVNDRHTLQSKFDQLRESMALASRELVADQTRWRNKEEEQQGRLELVDARLEAEARTRERLETEIERLEAQEKESMKARFQVEQTQQANVHLNKLIGQLRLESHEHQNTAARFQRELHAAKDSGVVEVQHLRSTMENDIKVAKNEVNVVRAELSDTIARLQKQLEDAAASADKVQHQHYTMFEKASASVADAHDKALQEYYRFHKRTVEELNARHQWALDNALEDRQRSETYLGNRLSLADEKLVLLQDKVGHLEEKLNVAKSAAHAAVQAAQINKTTASIASSRPAMTRVSEIPEKISPQALRESILVLQEQLQARETNIEDLEAKLATIGADAPAKLKNAEMEITWLRELLGVRIDDLQDIIIRLSQPTYDREVVRDAAIRLKANLQMEQQEKERALAGGQAFPSLSSISNLASSPKMFPLAAAAAWGNWRKGRASALSNLDAVADRSADQTPSKSPPSSRSFMAGLMTPSNTNIRKTSSGQSGSGPRPPPTSNRPLQGLPTAKQSLDLEDEDHLPERHEQIQQDPVTPPLMRGTSYDLDAAEATIFGVEGGTQSPNSDYEVANEGEPFGPRIGTFTA